MFNSCKLTIKKYRKPIAIGFEFSGLAILLFASAWQFFFTDWFDSQQFEWQFKIQNEMSYAILDGISDLSRQLFAENRKQADELMQKIYEVTHKAQMRSLSQRDYRDEFMEKGQAKFFSNVRGVLFFLGAVFIVIGKGFSFAEELSGLRS